MPAPVSPHIKAQVLAAVRQRLAAGDPLSRVALDVRIPKGTLSKWLASDRLHADYSRCGRPRKFALTVEESTVLRGLALKHESFALAIELFAHLTDCQPATRATIQAELDLAAQEQRRPRWPDSLRAEILPRGEELALLRGPKTFGSTEHSPRKGMFYEAPDGTRIPFFAYDVWTMDDYSTNQPYVVTSEDGTPRLCRQVLACMDVYSAGWLSVEMIGRERDAYRGEDIVRFIQRTIDAQGTLPVCLLLERGRWDSQAIHGVPLDDLGLEGKAWGALDDLFYIVHGFSSRHKAVIESSFNFLQTVLAHSGRDIGRVRGEYEAATKHYLAVQAGSRDPRAVGFIEQDAARAAHWQAMQLMNARSRERSAAEFAGRAIAPNDLLSTERDNVRPMPDAERWRFLPIKRIATVRGGFIETEVTHYGASFRFEVNGITDLYVSNGHKVLIAFDPAMPSLGCYVANATPKCREGWKIGQHIVTARHAEDVAHFKMHKRRAGEDTKKRANAAARTSFAAINPHKLGMTHTQAHNGAGHAVSTQTGTAPRPLLAPDPTTAAAPRRGVEVSGIGSGARHASPASDLDDVEAIAARRRASIAALEETHA